MSRRNPFDTYGKGFKQGMGDSSPLKTFTATATSGKEEQIQRKDESGRMPTPVALPPHLYIPSSGQSLDLRRLANVLPTTTVDLIVFTAPQGVQTKFIGYAVFNDALDFSLIEFVPTVDGKRIFPFHGDPQANFKIGLGLTPDMGNNALIQCQLDMSPGQVLKWTFTNNDVVDVAAGIRMSGYIDSTIIRKAGRVGG